MSRSKSPSAPSRTSSGQLDRSVRHSPYPSRHSSTSKSPDYAGVSDTPPEKLSHTVSSTGASLLRPTVYMIEESEVEGLLAPGVSSQESVQSLHPACPAPPSQDLQPHYPSQTRSVDHFRDYRQSLARPLSLQWSTATAATVPEAPYVPGQRYPSCGTLGSFGESSSESDTVEEMSWVETMPVPRTTHHQFDAFRSFGGDSEADSDHVSMEEVVIPVLFPTRPPSI
ncbi:hypothetical protein FRC06_000977 [Ceratobasidium sp. 370]|nr:hypothetical protein FRC06_000977 [Ceratobasidium sp. 370]